MRRVRLGGRSHGVDIVRAAGQCIVLRVGGEYLFGRRQVINCTHHRKERILIGLADALRPPAGNSGSDAAHRGNAVIVVEVAISNQAVVD